MNKYHNQPIMIGRVVFENFCHYKESLDYQVSEILAHVLRGIQLKPSFVENARCLLSCKYCKKDIGYFSFSENGRFNPRTLYGFLLHHYKTHIMFKDDEDPKNKNNLCTGMGYLIQERIIQSLIEDEYITSDTERSLEERTDYMMIIKLFYFHIKSL